jgi:hypothetical protein
MPELAATQIPKPANEQDFESANEVLWRCLLNDETVKTYGRRGQEQFGVDLTGIRNGNPEAIVGVQCKLKSEGKSLEVSEVKREVAKALTFEPPLHEYIIVTTAPDDAALDRLAHELSISISANRATPLAVKVMGWGSLSRQIRRHRRALDAFDPSHTPQGTEMLQMMAALKEEVAAMRANDLPSIRAEIISVSRVDPGAAGAADAAIEAEISGYADLVSTDPATALKLLSNLQGRLAANAGGRARFRIAANIAACSLELGNEVEAAKGLIAAFDFDPTNPKAASNKALGLLLQNDWPALQQFASAMFLSMPDNSALASYLIQGATPQAEITEPLLLVPDAVRHTKEVAMAIVRWTLDRRPKEEWWNAATDAHANHPEDPNLKSLYANALLDRVITRQGFLYGRILTADESEDVHRAITILQSDWDSLRKRRIDVSRKSVSVPLNLIVAYRLIHDADTAATIGQQALLEFDANPEVMERTAAALLEAGKTDAAKALIAKLPVTTESIMMRFNLAMSANDWPAVIKLVDEHLAVFPPHEQGLASASRIVALVELENPAKRHDFLAAQKDMFSGDCRACMVLAQMARIHGFDDLSDAFFDAGKNEIATSEVSFATRASFADEAIKRSEPKAAVDVLLGHVALDRDSPELRMLAAALAYDTPIRQRARDFFEQLPADIRQSASIRKYESVYHINRGAPEDAVAPLQSLFADEPQFQSLMALAGVYLRLERREEVAALVSNAAYDALPGHPVDRVNYAHVLLNFGEPARALQLGYEALVEGLDRADVAMRFFGLILNPAPIEREGPSTVGTGAWVKLTREHAPPYEAIIDEPADRPWGVKVDSGNAFIKRAIGLRVGDSFEHAGPFGTTEIWTVAEVKPRWLQAFHALSSTFAQRYPSASGFYMLSQQEGDIQPTLDQIRRHDEAIAERANLYLVNRVPMAFVAGDRAGGAIGFAEYLRDRGENVRTCVGDDAEREQAFAFIRENGQHGAMLDGFTAWRAAELDILPVLRTILGPLSIPSTEFERLKAIIDDIEIERGEERMTISYRDGKYFRQIDTAEERAANLKVLRDRIQNLEEGCTIEAVVLPDSLSEIGEALLTLPAGDAAAPAAIAGQRVFVSDDYMMRQIAETGFGTKGLWLQSVLLYALDQKLISLDRYSDALVLLSVHRHDFVSVSVDALVSVFERDSSANLLRLEALCIFLGSKGADPASHLRIAESFINAIWRAALPNDIRPAIATGIVLSALLLRNRGEEWVYWAAHLSMALNGEAKAYFIGGCRGHFLPLEQIELVQQQAHASQ